MGGDYWRRLGSPAARPACRPSVRISFPGQISQTRGFDSICKEMWELAKESSNVVTASMLMAQR